MIAGGGAGALPGTLESPLTAVNQLERRFPDGRAAVGVRQTQLQPEEDVTIVLAVSDVDAKMKFPGGWKAPMPCLRIVPQPR
jgi:hypothetical protein